METFAEKGIVRGPKETNGIEAGATGNGLIVARIQHDDVTAGVAMTPDEAERIAVGLIGAAAIERAKLFAEKPQVMDANGAFVNGLRQ